MSGWKLENTYAADLPGIFYSKLPPVPVKEPSLIILNEPLALSLGLNPEALRSEASQVLSGSSLVDGMQPIAQAYAGHQYGGFTMLGDGRAILLGEQVDPKGNRWDIQLKGSGFTPYSRRGDGRAALGPMLREYLISEAMFALGIPTTRSLAVVSTGEPVYRETILQGAVLTRVAASHIRVGTFQYAAMKDYETPQAGFVRQLADYVIQRHYPEIKVIDKDSKNPYESLLREIVKRQAKLIAMWMNVGFVHGVMNTDNMAVSGETIDYGPCAFMDRYDPGTVFSSIDQHGRYAYGNQPAIAQWNLTRLAETFIPLLNPTDEKAAIEIAQTILGSFGEELSKHWLNGMRSKLGLFESKPEDEKLFIDLLKWMQKNQMDFTNTFRAFSSLRAPVRDNGQSVESNPDVKDWLGRWEERRKSEGRSVEEVQKLMKQSNPNLIPRNYKVEEALNAAIEGNLTPFRDFLSALQRPFEDRPEHLPYLDPAPKDAEPYYTFCGT